MLGRNGNIAYVRYDHQGRIVPGGPIIQAKPPRNGNWQAVSNVIGTNTTSNALRAFIRIDYFNRVVPSSLVLLSKEPGDANSQTTWVELQAQYRGFTTTTTTTLAPVTTTSTTSSSSTSTTTSTSSTTTTTTVNLNPIVVNEAVNMRWNTTYSGNVLTNDSGQGGTTISITQFKISGITYTPGTTATITDVGTMLINANGACTFVPNLNYYGIVPVIEYTVTDSLGRSTVGNITFVVAQ